MKTMRKKIVLMPAKTKSGFSPYAVNYPVNTNGKLISELLGNAFEAVNLLFEGENIWIRHDNINLK